VEPGEPSDPLYIGALSMDGVVVEPEHRVDFLEEFWWLTSYRIRHIRSLSCRPAILDNRRQANLPENSTNIALSGQNDKLISGSA